MIGNIKKMQSKHTNPISYKIPIGDNFLPISDYLGRKINIEYLGEINCIGCNRSINKSFAQGYCYPCFINSPETSKCILRPELCRAHKGESRDMEWSKIHCLREHFILSGIQSFNSKVSLASDGKILMMMDILIGLNGAIQQEIGKIQQLLEIEYQIHIIQMLFHMFIMMTRLKFII